MRKLRLNPTLYFLTLSLIYTLSSCSDKCTVTDSYVYYEPVYATPAELKASIGFKPAQAMVAPGKIYLKDQILMVNETGKGIHFFDNKEPAHPVALGFLNIPGNFDLAVIDNTLYADSYVDLVAFDITDLKKIKETDRIVNLFNHSATMGYSFNSEKGVLTDWKMVSTISVTDSECRREVTPWGGIYIDDGIALRASESSNLAAAIAPKSTTGIGGSMSRFTIANKRLYALDTYSMDVVDVSQPFQPKAMTEIQVSWQAETLFAREETLFIGTRSGMYIFDIAQPTQPGLISQYQHVNSCDPVVVDGDYAYVTLRGGTVCNSYTNQLEVINIKDLKSPYVEKIYPMVNPHGLGIDNGTLFICDGSAGLKIFDAKDIYKITDNALAHYDKINAFDIIPHGKTAMVIGTDGLYQYDYSDIKKIQLLSVIEIAKP